MKKSNIASAISLALGTVAVFTSLQASAVGVGNTLSMNQGVTSCVSGDCANYGTNVTAGSWFGMDTDATSTITAGEKTAIGGHTGIVIGGGAQSATGSHSLLPFGAANSYTGTNWIQTAMDTSGNPLYMTDGNGNNVVATTTEVPGIDEPWGFFGNTGMDYTTSSVTVISSGSSTAVLNLSGWGVTWNGIPAIPMGSGAWGTGFTTSQGKMTCSGTNGATCGTGASYVLDYHGTVPNGDPSGFGNVKYALHLVGTVGTTVPVPAAAWLFGSGLVGLVGVARRKKSNA